MERQCVGHWDGQWGGPGSHGESERAGTDRTLRFPPSYPRYMYTRGGEQLERRDRKRGRRMKEENRRVAGHYSPLQGRTSPQREDTE